MSFWEKVKQTVRSYMNGRYGGDELSKLLLWGGFVLYIVGSFSRLPLLTLIGLAAYIVVIYRMFSRNIEKRRAENQRYLIVMNKWKTKWNQAAARRQNRKEYKYFKCPNCHSWLRLPHKVGEVTVTCGHCKNQFKMKA
jgi:flagellar biosynthesis component FlhA